VIELTTTGSGSGSWIHDSKSNPLGTGTCRIQRNEPWKPDESGNVDNLNDVLWIEPWDVLDWVLRKNMKKFLMQVRESVMLDQKRRFQCWNWLQRTTTSSDEKVTRPGKKNMSIKSSQTWTKKTKGRTRSWTSKYEELQKTETDSNQEGRLEVMDSFQSSKEISENWVDESSSSVPLASMEPEVADSNWTRKKIEWKIKHTIAEIWELKIEIPILDQQEKELLATWQRWAFEPSAESKLVHAKATKRSTVAQVLGWYQILRGNIWK
jgi:hypothetical protein